MRELLELSGNPERYLHEANKIASANPSAIQVRIKKLEQTESELKHIASYSDAGHIGEYRVIQFLADHALY